MMNLILNTYLFSIILSTVVRNNYGNLRVGGSSASVDPSFW